MHLLLGVGNGPGGDGKDLGGVHLQAVQTDDVPQEREGGGKKLTLFCLNEERILQQTLEDSLDMIYVFLPWGEDQDVVQVDKHVRR